MADPVDRGLTRRADLSQPVFAGIVASLVGFAGSFPIVLAGFHAVGASDAEAASGLLALSVAMGVCGLGLSLGTRMPISVAWSTPGAALLVASGSVAGGWHAALGAFLLAGVLVVLTSLSSRLTRLIASVPVPLASALLAGVLLSVCIQPARAVVQQPRLATPVVVAWLVLSLFARRWAVLGALAVAALGVAIHPSASAPPAHLAPQLIALGPHFVPGTLIGVGIPLFVVTMVSQNVAGLSVLSTFGYRPEVRPLLGGTGAASIAVAPFGGHAVNLAAITAALSAGPDAHPDPDRRWIAAAAGSALYIALGAASGLSTALLGASPVVLIEAVAGLALLGTLGAALRSATREEGARDAAMVTLAVTVSGISVAGISAPFWGFVAGLALFGLRRVAR